jgi:hypothetical protein
MSFGGAAELDFPHFAAAYGDRAVRGHGCMITRLRLDASLFKPAPKLRREQCGRPAQKGRASPKLNVVLKSKKTVWRSEVVS